MHPGEIHATVAVVRFKKESESPSNTVFFSILMPLWYCWWGYCCVFFLAFGASWNGCLTYLLILSTDGQGPVHNGVCSTWIESLKPGDMIPCSVRQYVNYYFDRDWTTSHKIEQVIALVQTMIFMVSRTEFLSKQPLFGKTWVNWTREESNEIPEELRAFCVFLRTLMQRLNNVTM